MTGWANRKGLVTDRDSAALAGALQLRRRQAKTCEHAIEGARHLSCRPRPRRPPLATNRSIYRTGHKQLLPARPNANLPRVAEHGRMVVEFVTSDNNAREVVGGSWLVVSGGFGGPVG